MSASSILSVLPVGALNGATAVDASGPASDDAAMGAFAGLLESVLAGEGMAEGVATDMAIAPVAPIETAPAENYGLLASALNAASLNIVEAPTQPAAPTDASIMPVQIAPLDAQADPSLIDQRTRHETPGGAELSLIDIEAPQDIEAAQDKGADLAAALLAGVSDTQITPETVPVQAPVDAAPVEPAPVNASAKNAESNTASLQLRATELKLAQLAQNEEPALTAEDDASAAPAQTTREDSAKAQAAIDSALRATSPQAIAQNQGTDAKLMAPHAAAMAPKTAGEFKSNAASARADDGGNALKAVSEDASALVGKDVQTDATKLAEQGTGNGFDLRPQATQSPLPTAAPVTSDTSGEMATTTLEAQSAIQQGAQGEASPLPSQLSLANIRTTAEIAAHFIQKLGQRVARFDMVLTPETLGTVEVAMEVGADGEIKARMVFDTPVAANELRARAEELRRQLNEAGFQVAENALEFTDRESDQRGGFNQFFSDGRSSRRAFAGANRLADAADLPVPPVWTPVNLTPTGVDLKV